MKHSRKNVANLGKPNVLLIGKIYANWCGHCEHLKPEWNKMKASIRNKLKTVNNIAVRFVEIEQNEEQQKVGKINRVYLKNSEQKLSVQRGYPTLFKIHGGQVEYFQGGRSAEEMEQFYLKTDKNQFGGEETPVSKQKGSGIIGYLFGPLKVPTKSAATDAAATDAGVNAEAAAAAKTAEAEAQTTAQTTDAGVKPAEKAENTSVSKSWFGPIPSLSSVTSLFGNPANQQKQIGGKSKKNRTKKSKKRDNTRKNKK